MASTTALHLQIPGTLQSVYSYLMSESYEGVIACSTPEEVHRVFDQIAVPVTLRLCCLSQTVFGIYRTAKRSENFDCIVVEAVAAQVSLVLGSALAVFYDNSCGVREAVLFTGGQKARNFGKGDELWVVLDEEGGPCRDATKLKPSKLDDDEEYDCVWCAINAGLDALGVGGEINPERLKDAFCNERCGWEAERSATAIETV